MNPTTTDADSPKYAGFWIRVLAHVIDSIIFIAIITPLLITIYGDSYLAGEIQWSAFWNLSLNYIFPTIAIILFWFYKSASPGKMTFKIKIVDVNTLSRPSLKQVIIRYTGYLPSVTVLCLGMIWVGIDKRKQGWHDKLAGTLVIISKPKTVDTIDESP